MSDNEDAPPQANAALAAWCGAGTALVGSHPPDAAGAGPRDPPTGPQRGTGPGFERRYALNNSSTKATVTARRSQTLS